MKTCVCTITMAVAMALTSASATAAPAGTGFTYQGQLKQDESPLNEKIDLQFTLFDADTGGSQVGATVVFDGQAGNAAPIDVANGLFTLELDFGVTAFDGSGRWLEVQVRSPHDPLDAAPYIPLTPRQAVTPTPYALQTRGLYTDANGNVGIGTTNPQGALHVNTNEGVPLRVSTSDPTARFILEGADGSSIRAGDDTTRGLVIQATSTINTGAFVRVAGLDNDTQGLGGGGVLIEAARQGTDGDIMLRTQGIDRLIVNQDGNVGIGTTVPTSQLHVRRDSVDNVQLLSLDFAGGNVGGTSEADALMRVTSTSGFRPYLSLDGKFVVTAGGNVGIGTTSPDAKLHVDSLSGSVNLRLSESCGTCAAQIVLQNASRTWDVGADASPDGFYIMETGGSQGEFFIAPGGNVGIGTTSPGGRLTVAGVVESTAGFKFPDGTVQTTAADGGGGGSKWTSSGSEIFYNAGNVGIGTSTPGSKLAIDANDNQLLLSNPSATRAVAFVFNTQAGDPQQGGLTIQRRNPDGTWGADSRILMTINVADGTVSVPVLQITGGADLAEPFEVSTTDGASTEIEPGSVVVIDADRPGRLKLADSPYDRKVAGVISGAGGLKPGLVMQAADRREASGTHPVAMSGRVWCLCDASFGGIQPGDLLTTSNTPGHAMKVRNHDESQGAVLGKAMTSLKSGKGLVLVLVTLQ